MKPQRTVADYVVSSLSPVLIMLLVGSLVFFLIQVFYHGKTVLSLRWVMFWFVMGIVLVSRIGIEEGMQRSILFGFALAGATSIYLMRTYPAFLLGTVLLGVVWWCAHKLTWNCTYVDDEEDASGQGLMETLPDQLRRHSQAKKAAPQTAAEKSAERQARLGGYFVKARRPQTPGLWVIFFSAAALPLFGLGQMLLPGDASRRIGFVFLFVYLAAALGLFLTTSFLGLRRYLRQRYLRMPRSISLGWLRFGGGMIFTVLALALLLPRPGADYTWKTVALRVDEQLRRASDLATAYNPHGQGQGRAGDEKGGTKDSSSVKENSPDQPPQPAGTEPHPNDQAQTPPPPASASAPALPSPQSGNLHRLFRALLLIILALFFLGWLWRNYQLILQVIQAFLEAIRNFLASLSGTLTTGKPTVKTPPAPAAAALHPFAHYHNPFATGDDKSWPPERVIVYTYEAVQAWAKERGIEFPPQQTPREFCAELGARHPEIVFELGHLTLLYGHAAYGTHLPAGYDTEPIRQIWRIISN